MPELRAWQHPGTGEVRIYCNGHELEYAGVKIYLVRSVGRDGGLGIDIRFNYDGATQDMSRLIKPVTLVARAALAEVGLSLKKRHWPKLVERAYWRGPAREEYLRLLRSKMVKKNGKKKKYKGQKEGPSTSERKRRSIIRD